MSVGVGGDPYTVTGGKVYLTGPYNGAPFGLSIVTPVIAGPFDLGTVVVRAAIYINPYAAQVLVPTDPFPRIVDGIPLQIGHVDVTIDRPGFMFNPTSCNPMSITGTIIGAEGASSYLSSPFQVTDCAGLAFKPSFTASTQGKTNKKLGASLHVKLVPPHEGPQSTGTANASGTGSTSGTPGNTSVAQTEEANIAKVKVELPKQLPSRLTTLQKACTSAQFDANPAGCPVPSIIGHAVVHTPILPVPLEGPVYFVSNGGEAFPSLTMVLQGYGITIDLVGNTQIKNGITSSTFAHVPDAPVSSFELTLPEGKFSALAANANLCTVKGGLKMPTQFTAQNGAVLKQNTAIAVTGCPKAKTAAQLRAAKLAAALKACRRDRGAARSGCERAARKKYGAVKKRK